MTQNSTNNNSNIVNVAAYLKRMARLQPFKRAVVYPAGRHPSGHAAYAHLTFEQLEKESDRTAAGLETAGIRRGVRTILMVRPGPDFFVLIFALFKMGAVPVVVDPGMGIRRMVECLKESRPKAFIGIPLAHVLRMLFPAFFRTVSIWITVGRRRFWGGHTLSALNRRRWEPYPLSHTRADDAAAILFTTGSTGPAKGAVYTHGNFEAQLRQIKTYLGISTDEIDLSTFPLFALFWPALGITSVIPDMDPTQPARANPVKIIEAINDHGVTSMFASPALLNRVGRYGKLHRIQLPSLRRVISAGAPVAPEIIERFSGMLPKGAEVHTPYGATEAVPVLSIRSGEILSQTRKLSEQGLGTCIGYPINDIKVRIIRISDEPIATWSDDLAVPDGEVGEITVKGDLVTRSYFNRPEADALAKVRDGHAIWHRMGDLGRRDEKGRIWFYGRKSHRVRTSEGTLFTIPCETIFNTHPRVFRSALVGIGCPPHQRPVVCIELEQPVRRGERPVIWQQLLDLAKANAQTRTIETVLFCKAFPVDIRHNSKIFRERLSVWATRKLGNQIRS